MVTPPKSTNRLLYSLLGVVCALVILSVVLVLSRGPAPVLDPSTPEGVVQRYTQALLSGDKAGAAALLEPSSTVKEECRYSRADRSVADLRITLGRTTIAGGKATVEVLVAQGSAGGPFGTGESSYPDAFELRGADGSWSIVSAPWMLLACTGTEVK